VIIRSAASLEASRRRPGKVRSSFRGLTERVAAKSNGLHRRNHCCSSEQWIFKAWGNLPRWGEGSMSDGQGKGRHADTYRPIAVSFRPVIPRRVASQQSPLPLRRTICTNQERSPASSLLCRQILQEKALTNPTSYKVSDDGPIGDDATRTGAVVRKPPGKETAIRGTRERAAGSTGT
jgi:hypothetical protein